jgi:hypothetical protein
VSHPLDRDGSVLWGGQLPLPIAYHIFLVRMHEAHVPEAEGTIYVPEIRMYEIQSALARGDEKTAETYFIDMYATQKHRRVIRISKFSPGEHYYVGRDKFGSLEEAQEHARRLGYVVLPGVDVQSMNDLILAARAARGLR